MMHQVSRATSSITLSWPQPDQPNGVILDYQLRYFDKVRREWCSADCCIAIRQKRMGKSSVWKIHPWIRLDEAEKSDPIMKEHQTVVSIRVMLHLTSVHLHFPAWNHLEMMLKREKTLVAKVKNCEWNNWINLASSDTGNSGRSSSFQESILEMDSLQLSCVSIYTSMDTSKKFWQKGCSLSFTSWQIPVTCLCAEMTRWHIQSHSPFTSFITPNLEGKRSIGLFRQVAILYIWSLT